MNRRPRLYQRRALPTELPRQKGRGILPLNYFGSGQGGIRTPVARRRVVYSHVQLAALAPALQLYFIKKLTTFQRLSLALRDEARDETKSRRSFFGVFDAILRFFCGGRRSKP